MLVSSSHGKLFLSQAYFRPEVNMEKDIMLVSFLEKMGKTASSSGLYGQMTVSEIEPLWHLHMSGSLFSNQFSLGGK